MQAEEAWDAILTPLSEVVAANLGLHFPRERHMDLQRGVCGAAKEVGSQDPLRYAQSLLSNALSREQLAPLAAHLTVGETYFFRDRPTFDALTAEALPELIRMRREDGSKVLRFWSTACSTGEEAYSLAILIRQLLPDWQDWRLTILATDINEHALRKAREGVYGKWSFRNCPPEIQERYFTPASEGEDQYAIRPEIKSLVKFEPLNLAKDTFPAAASDTVSMDVILCRNVLIYFTAEHTQSLIEKLRHALAQGGWLAVSPSECSQTLFSRFAAFNFPGAILYRKPAIRPRPQPVVISARTPVTVAPAVDEPTVTFSRPAANEPDVKPPEKSASALATLTRRLADEGRLSEALVWSKQWVSAEKLNAAAHYLHATIAQELGDLDAARRSLQKSIYLQPDFALGHFALGNLARMELRQREAVRHFENALGVVRDLAPEVLLPESDGLTAGRLAELIAALLPAARATPTNEKRTS
jgi:chemotaxis protein methyltransferase CheR